ncbi:MAG: ABC transporter substrate-binding protein [Legionellaceae bacterium]|nr:ABC transporter substrate-binding protein [Legionellaceae bacterium]
MNTKKIATLMMLMLSILMVSLMMLFPRENKTNLPLVAIANYGPHSSLEASIQGIKDELSNQGYIEHKTIRYEVTDVGFEPSLIPQMIMNLKSHHPSVFVVTTTPVAQYAKGTVKDIPLVYNVITDPVAAGLLNATNASQDNMTGSSDKQDMRLLFDFAKRILPHASNVGVLYSTAEANDMALVAMMKQAAKNSHMHVLAMPIDQARDISVSMQKFKHHVDFIYVGASGAIQPALPVIAAESKKMGIPVFNLNEEAVRLGLVLASFGVDYHRVGMNTGKLVARGLRGESVTNIQPVYPTIDDHHGFVSQKNAVSLGLILPEGEYHAAAD